MNNLELNSIKDKLLKDIEAGKVKMKPRWQFVSRAVLWVLGLVLATLTLLYLASFIIFILAQTGVWFIPGFGLRAIGPFFASLPWLLLLIAVVFLILMEMLVKRYSFGYRKPLLYSVAGIIIFVLIGGFAIAQTPFHRGLFEQANNNRLPIAGGLYREFGMRPPHNLEIGIVSEVRANGYLISNPRNQIIEITTNAETEYPLGNDIQINDNIVSFGKRINDTVFEASVVREVDKLPRPPLRGLRPPPR